MRDVHVRTLRFDFHKVVWQHSLSEVAEIRAVTCVPIISRSHRESDIKIR